MKVLIFAAGALAAYVGLPAVHVPTVSNVQLVQTGSKVTVTYDLSGDGIVTADFLTNGVTVGSQALAGLEGDVCRKVTAGTGKSFVWKPRASWPVCAELGKMKVMARVTAWADNAPPDYLVADLTKSKDLRYYESAEAVPFGVTDRIYKTDKMVFRLIKAAGKSFRMGSPRTEVGRQLGRTDTGVVTSLETAHTVTFTNDFYLAIYEMTQRQYRHITPVSAWAPNPHFTDGEDAEIRPAESITWHTCHTGVNTPESSANRFAFVNTTGIGRALSGITGLPMVQVPTEAEWEFACRAGGNAAFYWGGELTKNGDGSYANVDLGEYAWYADNAEETTHPVGLKKPNAWGLYDMIGNVAELTLDRLSNDSNCRYPTATVDPVMANDEAGFWPKQDSHIVRGGSWWDPATACRSASRCCPQVTYGSFSGPNSFWHVGARLSIRLH